jgi:transposase InsO family protein
MRSCTELEFTRAYNGEPFLAKGEIRSVMVLNANQFLSIEDARSKIEAWRIDYNLHRPHSSLGQLNPGSI